MQIFRSLEMGSRTIIFTSTKRMCDQLGSLLMRQVGCGVIHGDKDQWQRQQSLNNFKASSSRLIL